MSLTTVQRVLQALLAEKISIRDLPTILDAIAEAAPQSTSSGLTWSEHVRTRVCPADLRRHCAARDGATPPIMTCCRAIGRMSSADALDWRTGRRSAARHGPLQTCRNLWRRPKRPLEEAAAKGHSAAIVTSATVRPFVRSVIERVRPQTMVLSQNEIHPHTRLKNLGQI